jgi:hypothetical protein
MPAYDGVLFTPPAPLALASIQDPSTGETVNDVPMLLDTGGPELAWDFVQASAGHCSSSGC